MSPDAFLGLDPDAYGVSAPLGNDIRLLDRLLGEALREQEGPELLELARRLFEQDGEGDPLTLLQRVPELQDAHTVQLLLKAYATLFQLLNTAEQKEIVRVNRERQARVAGMPRPESIREAVVHLREAGLSAEGMQALLSRIDICPTLTAHPTEARRRVILDKLLTIARWLAQSSVPAQSTRLDLPLNTVGLSERELRRALAALWQTDELRAAPMTVEDEVRNVLYFLQHSILDVVAWLHNDLRFALQRAYPGHAFDIPPFLKYRSWVGGDRDGNPNVTPEVTWRTLLQHKRVALECYLDRVGELQRELTLSTRMAPASDELLRSLAADAQAIPLPPETLERHRLEPYSVKLLYMASRLRASLSHLSALSDMHAEGPSFVAQPPAYRRSAEFLDDLLILQRSLREARADVLADVGALPQLILQVRTAGFHLASLDVRQHSDEHATVLDEILVDAQVLPPGSRYSDLDEEAKTALLARELSSPRPLLPRDWVGSADVQRVFLVFEAIRHAQRYISPDAVTAYVISMTHGVSDVLEVLLLAKEAGLVRWCVGESGPVLESDLDVVPLFETIDDLRRCHRLMRRLFATDAYRRHLKARGDFQEIMLGYSDSSKDGGYLAANWALHDTQARLARTCEKAGVRLRFFHGRGGTVGRGGGRANRAILSQPTGSFNGRIRFTEQGEVISFRYALAPIAHRHLEQIVNAVLLATDGERSSGAQVLRSSGEQVAGVDTDPSAQLRTPRAWHRAMREMAHRSREAYRAMVYDDPEFWDFYTQATPVAHISRLPITSRPAFRPGQARVGLEGLRAIPWVFAWVQSRYVVPGWYGLGSALAWFAGRSAGNVDLLRTMYAEWPFFQTVVNNAELELLRAHLPTAAWYASRVQPRALGERFHALIAEEHARTTEWVLTVTGQRALFDNAPTIGRLVALRNPAVMPMSKLQVALLDLWDHGPDAHGGADTAWRDALLLSIAGIAAAMQSTG